jgi:hypothetical protein
MKHFGHKNFFFLNIRFDCPLLLLMMIQDCDMWHNFFKIPHGILTIYWEN